jgi:hypothetical protein
MFCAIAHPALMFAAFLKHIAPPIRERSPERRQHCHLMTHHKQRRVDCHAGPFTPLPHALDDYCLSFLDSTGLGSLALVSAERCRMVRAHLRQASVVSVCLYGDGIQQSTPVTVDGAFTGQCVLDSFSSSTCAALALMSTCCARLQTLRIGMQRFPRHACSLRRWLSRLLERNCASFRSLEEDEDADVGGIDWLRSSPEVLTSLSRCPQLRTLRTGDAHWAFANDDAVLRVVQECRELECLHVTARRSVDAPWDGNDMAHRKGVSDAIIRRMLEQGDTHCAS